MAENKPPEDQKITPPYKNSEHLLNVTDVLKGLKKTDIDDLVDIFELFEEKIKNYHQLRKAMRKKKMLEGDGVKRFMNAVKGIGRIDLYKKFVKISEVGEDEMHVEDDRKVHVKFNTLKIQISKIMCIAKNRRILVELKEYFDTYLPENELGKATCKTFIKLLQKRSIITWDNLDELTTKLESILGTEKYNELFGGLITEYFIDIENERKGTIEVLLAAEVENTLNPVSAEFEVVNENGDPFIDETIGAKQVDRESSQVDDGNQMDHEVNGSENSPVPKKRRTSNNSSENITSNTIGNGPKVGIQHKSAIYPMKSKPCGNCIIFNNSFKGQGKKIRKGTKVDEKKLQTLFNWLQFNVKIFEDSSEEAMIRQLTEEANDPNLKDHDCFVVFILSHGFEGGVYANDGKELTFNSITDIFDKCKALITKPKLFFVQACQGKNHIYPISNDGNEIISSPQTIKSAPMKADHIIVKATTPNNVAYRDTNEGTWFIQDLCSIFQVHAGACNLMSLLTKLNDKMSERTDKNSNGEVVTAMSCADGFTLRKDIFFNPMGNFNDYIKKQVKEEDMIK